MSLVFKPRDNASATTAPPQTPVLKSRYHKMPAVQEGPPISATGHVAQRVALVSDHRDVWAALSQIVQPDKYGGVVSALSNAHSAPWDAILFVTAIGAELDLPRAETASPRATVQRFRPSRHEDARVRLDMLRTLEHGWNGYDSEPIPGELIDVGLELLQKPVFVANPPEVFPTARATVQFEYHREVGVGDPYLEVELLGNTYVVLLEKRDGSYVESELTDWAEVEAVIREFHAR